MSEIKRNDPCPCGSGKKFKKCCMNKPIQKKVSLLSSGGKVSKLASVISSNTSALAGRSFKALSQTKAESQQRAPKGPAPFHMTNEQFYVQRDSKKAADSVSLEQVAQEDPGPKSQELQPPDEMEPFFINQVEGPFEPTDDDYSKKT